MTLVPSLTPFTCALACLESFFLDIESTLNQCEILKKFPQFCTNPDINKRHEFGAMSEDQMVGFCRHLNFKVGYFRDFNQLNVEASFRNWLLPNKCVLICLLWKGQTNHCVRLSRIISDGKYEVMNPSLGVAEWSEVTFDELVDWDFRFLLIGT